MARRGLGDPVWMVIGLAAAVAFLIARAWNPDSPGVQLCVFRNLLEVPCPGCGLTRAMSHLARGSVDRAFVLHPLAPALALEVAFAWVAWGVVGRERIARWFSGHVEALVTLHAVPYFALWLGRAATGTLPF